MFSPLSILNPILIIISCSNLFGSRSSVNDLAAYTIVNTTIISVILNQAMNNAVDNRILPALDEIRDDLDEIFKEVDARLFNIEEDLIQTKEMIQSGSSGYDYLDPPTKPSIFQKQEFIEQELRKLKREIRKRGQRHHKKLKSANAATVAKGKRAHINAIAAKQIAAAIARLDRMPTQNPNNKV
jgi:hypothetical protein